MKKGDDFCIYPLTSDSNDRFSIWISKPSLKLLVWNKLNNKASNWHFCDQTQKPSHYVQTQCLPWVFCKDVHR